MLTQHICHLEGCFFSLDMCVVDTANTLPWAHANNYNFVVGAQYDGIYTNNFVGNSIDHWFKFTSDLDFA